MQEKEVGNIRLEMSNAESDKSAMPTVDQVRATIRRAMAQAKEGPVALAVELGIERNYIRDFLEKNKKNSMKTEVTLAISERYNIPLKDLLISKTRLKKSA